VSDGLRGSACVIRGGVPIGGDCAVRTRYQLASVSKQFAAVLVLKLELPLDEPITRWFPAAPDAWRAITLQHLLSHTSGIGHWSDIPGFIPSEAMDVDRRLALFQRAPLLSRPGTEYHYSSPTFLLIGDIVGRATGRPYTVLLETEIFGPLGLAQTNTGPPPADADVAEGHRDGAPVPPWDLASMAGTGDIWSTAGDLARFTWALHTGAVLPADAYRAMITPSPVAPYGYGMFVGTVAGQPARYHTGDNPGFVSLAAWFPDESLALAVLSNDEVTDLDRAAGEVLRTVAGVVAGPAG
jgi:CubicO group peptidase (beta-lactamase class C family)